MNWGNKLVIVFIAFAGMMATLVYNAVTTKFELVTKDYYREELRFQEQIDGAANAAYAGEVTLQQDHATVTLQLPAVLHASIAEGEAWFYCKTDASKDRRIPVKIENGIYIIDRSTFLKGSYELKLKLTVDHKQYYFTNVLTVE